MCGRACLSFLALPAVLSLCSGPAYIHSWFPTNIIPFLCCSAPQSQLRQCIAAGLVTGLWAVFWDIEWRWPAPPARDDRFWIFFRVSALR